MEESVSLYSGGRMWLINVDAQNFVGKCLVIVYIEFYLKYRQENRL